MNIYMNKHLNLSLLNCGKQSYTLHCRSLIKIKYKHFYLVFIVEHNPVHISTFAQGEMRKMCDQCILDVQLRLLQQCHKKRDADPKLLPSSSMGIVPTPWWMNATMVTKYSKSGCSLECEKGQKHYIGTV